MAADSKSINYTEAVAEISLFTLSGVSKTDGITVNNGVVTVNADNLNAENVSITGEVYTLALASGISAHQTTSAAFDGLEYKSSYVSTAGYTLAADSKSITYTATSSPSTLFTLAGVKSTDGITVNNGVVTITAENLNGANVSITGEGYTLALANGISAHQTTAAAFSGLEYKSAYVSTAGYTLAADSKSRQRVVRAHCSLSRA